MLSLITPSVLTLSVLIVQMVQPSLSRRESSRPGKTVLKLIKESSVPVHTLASMVGTELELLETVLLDGLVVPAGGVLLCPPPPQAVNSINANVNRKDLKIDCIS